MSRALQVAAIVASIVAAGALVLLDADHPYDVWLALAAGVGPLTVATGLLVARTADARLELALTGLATGGPDDTVRDALRRALADPDLDIVYAKIGSGGWISGLGVDAEPPGRDDARVFTPIDRGGKPLAGIVHARRLLRSPERLQAAMAAASLALDNERVKAQLRAELLQAQASRARVVEASDRELRRLERDLHDGAQQRLVALALRFSLA